MLDTIQEKIIANMRNYSTVFGHCWYVEKAKGFILRGHGHKRTVHVVVIECLL